MRRYIDADKLQEAFKELHGGKRSLLIDTAPTADVVQVETLEGLPSAQPEIIRCKDCKWWGRKDTYKDGSTMIVCKKGRSIESDGFCHYAELRGDSE